MIPGYANFNSTRKYGQKFTLTYRTFSEFVVSPIALGTHLGEMNEIDSDLYREGIQYGLQNGLNFIDTALNYRGMRSERDIGYVLKSLIHDKKILSRESIVVSSKAGIIPGDVMKNLFPKEYLQKVLLEPGIIQGSDLNEVEHQKHVLTPRYYQFAIAQSKQHLNLGTIDIYYVHNPEISMMALGPETFYQNMESVFSTLEDQVQCGNIRYYGLATWTGLLKSPEDNGYISIEEVVNRAKSIAGEGHHFKFIQFPLNKQFTESITFKNQLVQNEFQPLLVAAEKLGLSSTTSAPFQLGKVFKENQDPHECLQEIIQTGGVLSTMVGMKQVKHIKENIMSILPDARN
ncbi:aldo/keto reductase [Rossellomorea sp. NPDC077527]|uniref:aldo/keto reductase n=1 Tax=Rossellomorea sp. NPDC077527 TaxID=3364510 RepID=UPI0037C711D8